ncbi:MAG: hypothetical protein ACRD5L_13410 [Bryobacteraceae bacterium]
MAAKVAVQTPPPVFQPPPEIVAELPPDPPPLPTVTPQFSAPAPVRTTRPTPLASKPVAAPPAIEMPAVIEPVPQLGQIFTPAQILENNRTLDDYIQRVTRDVNILATKNLSKDQRDTAELVRNFLAQAEQTRDTDLAAAVSLAKKAYSLAKDLLDRLP